MKLELTERDKALLPVLGMLALAAVYLFLVILPLHRANVEMLGQLETAKAGMLEKQKKIAALTSLRTSNEALMEELDKVQEPLFPFMESREIGKSLTEIALRHGLSIRRMEIWMPMDVSDRTDLLEADQVVVKAEVLLEVAGSRVGKDGLLDEIAYETDSIRIITMRRMTDKSRSESGTDVLELRLEILMCGS